MQSGGRIPSLPSQDRETHYPGVIFFSCIFNIDRHTLSLPQQNKTPEPLQGKRWYGADEFRSLYFNFGKGVLKSGCIIMKDN